MLTLKRVVVFAGLAGLLVAALVRAAEYVVTQKNRQFSTNQMKVKVGDSVSFRNDDPFFHNIFSLSETQSFDLGSYPQGQAKKVTFTKAGRVEVECAIHPEMKMVVEVAQ